MLNLFQHLYMHPGKIIKTFTSKKGNTVIIRYPKLDDLDAVLKFVNDLVAEDTFIMLNEIQTREQEEKWLKDTLAAIASGGKIHLVADVNGHYAGNCEIRIHDKRQTHVGDIGISVAEQYRDEGIGRELLLTLIEEGKNASLKLLILQCFENNDRALHLYESLGFIHAGLVPGVYAYKGRFVGEVTLCLPLHQ